MNFCVALSLIIATIYIDGFSNQWELKFGGVNGMTNFMISSGDGFLVFGGRTNLGSMDQSGIVGRIAENGEIDWVRILASSGFDDIACGVFLSQGSIILGGRLNAGNPLLVKMYQNGTIEWAKSFAGGIPSSRILGVKESERGGFLAWGSVDYGDSADYEAFFLRYDEDDIIDFMIGFGTGDNELINEVFELVDGYILSGQRSKLSLLAKVDLSGDWVWGKWYQYGTSVNHQYCEYLTPCQDGGYVQGSISEYSGSTNYNALIVKFFANFTVEWAREVDGAGSERFYFAEEMVNGDLLFVGYTGSRRFPDFLDSVVMRLSSSGEYLWGLISRDPHREDSSQFFDAQIVSNSTSNSSFISLVGTLGGEQYLSKIPFSGLNGPERRDLLNTCIFGDDLEYSDYMVIREIDIVLSVPTYVTYSPSLTVGRAELNVTDAYNSSYNKVLESKVEIICYTCNGVSSNVSSLTGCSGNGICGFDGFCNCVENYDGIDCSYCKPNYYGDLCNVTTCFGELSSSSPVCNNQGSCFIFDQCECHENFFGETCNVTSCFNVLSNDTQLVCTDGRGECTAPNKCECKGSYYGENCNISTCFEFLGNETTTVCSGHGKCGDLDICHCDPGYSDLMCQNFTCNNISRFSVEKVCLGHGECVSLDECACSGNYSNVDCKNWKCFGVWNDHNNDTTDPTLNVCNGHGECVDFNTCNCSKRYPGYKCHEWSCNELAHFTPNVCNGNGVCLDWDDCLCFPGYTSKETYCSDYYCGGIHHSQASKVCSGGRGTCLSPDNCRCRDNYEGDDCETFSCQQIDQSAVGSVCSGHGVCVSPGKCACESGWVRDDCSYDRSLALSLGIAVPVVSLLFIFCFCIVFLLGSILVLLIIGIIFVMFIFCGSFLFLQKKRIKRFSQLKNFDILLKEQEMDEDATVAHLRIDPTMFEIDIEEIKTIKILGEGGSQSIVFLSKWKGKDVAFKCFKTRLVCQSQDKFDEFEREVKILSSISHPYIIRFFGASMKPPRVGIVMEYCPNGEILDFFKSYAEKQEGKYPFIRKLCMMAQIAGAMSFLHSRRIIHRDLKCENCLIDQNEDCKMMDFGLSRIVDRMSHAKTTRVGTNVYMSPEIVNSDKYTEKCDVFSFAIMTFIMFTESEHPYEGQVGDEFHIELKVARDPEFRPRVDDLDDILQLKTPQNWLKQLITKCWSHDHEERYSFVEIEEYLEKHGVTGESADSSLFLDVHDVKEKKRNTIVVKHDHDEEEKSVVDWKKKVRDLDHRLKEKMEFLRSKLEKGEVIVLHDLE